MHKYPEVKQLWIEWFSIIYLHTKLLQPKRWTPHTDICFDRSCFSPASPTCGINPSPVPHLQSRPWPHHQANCSRRRRGLASSTETSFTALCGAVSLHKEQGNTDFCLRLMKNWSKTPICANVGSADGFGAMSSNSIFLQRTGKIQTVGIPESPIFLLSEFLQGIPQPITQPSPQIWGFRFVP